MRHFFALRTVERTGLAHFFKIPLKLVDAPDGTPQPYVRCKGVPMNMNYEIKTSTDDVLDFLNDEEEREHDRGFEGDETLLEMETEEGVEVDDLGDVETGLDFDKMKRLVSGETKRLVTKQMQM